MFQHACKMGLEGLVDAQVQEPGGTRRETGGGGRVGAVGAEAMDTPSSSNAASLQWRARTQKALSLLFGPRPGGPPEAISRIRMIFVDCGHGPPFELDAT